MKRLKLIVTSILILAIVVLSVQNAEPVETRFLTYSFTLPRAVLLAAATAIGFLVGVLWTLRLSRENRKGPEERVPEPSRRKPDGASE